MNKNLLYLIKSIGYRIYSSFITFLISALITEKVALSFYIGLTDFIVKIFTYYLYEYFWEKGKEKINKHKQKKQNDNKSNRSSRSR